MTFLSGTRSGGEAVLELPAVEPLDCVVEALGRAAFPQVIADQALDTLGVEQATHFARREHDPRRARDPRALIELESLVEAPVVHAEGFAQRHCILERHAG